MRRFAVLAGALAAGVSAWGQSYPSKPLRLVVPYSTGATPDILARLLADKLAAKYGQPVVVENKPGAGGIVAATSVTSAPADGYTLFLADNGQLSIAPHLYKKLPFNPLQDFAPVTQLVNQPFLIWANVDTGARTMREVLALARAKPGALNYGSVGSGSPHHLCLATVAKAAGVELNHIPYKSAANQLVPAMMSNEVSLTCTSPVAAGPMVAAGKVVPLAVASRKRTKLQPSVPTFAEATALQHLEIGASIGIVVKTGTPKEVVDRLGADIDAVMRSPDVVSRLEGVGMDIVGGGSMVYEKTLRDDFERYGAMVKASGAVAE